MKSFIERNVVSARRETNSLQMYSHPELSTELYMRVGGQPQKERRKLCPTIYPLQGGKKSSFRQHSCRNRQEEAMLGRWTIRPDHGGGASTTVPQ